MGMFALLGCSLLLSIAFAVDLSNDVIMNSLSFLNTPKQTELRLVDTNFKKASDRLNTRHIDNVNSLLNYVQNIRNKPLTPPQIVHIKRIYDESRYHPYHLSQMASIIPKLYGTKTLIGKGNSKIIRNALYITRKQPDATFPLVDLLIDVSQKLTRYYPHQSNDMRKCLSFLYLTTWNYLSAINGTLFPKIDRVCDLKNDGANQVKSAKLLQSLACKGLILWDAKTLDWKWDKSSFSGNKYFHFHKAIGSEIANKVRQNKVDTPLNLDFLGYLGVQFAFKLLNDSHYDLSQVELIDPNGHGAAGTKFRTFATMIRGVVKHMAQDEDRFDELAKFLQLVNKRGGCHIVEHVCPGICGLFKVRAH